MQCHYCNCKNNYNFNKRVHRVSTTSNEPPNDIILDPSLFGQPLCISRLHLCLQECVSEMWLLG